MIKSIEKFVNVLAKSEIIKSEDKDIIAYGISVGLELCFNIATTIALGLVFGLAAEGLFFLVSFALVRTYAGGYHCQKATNCYLVSTGIILMVLTVVKLVPKENMLLICVGTLLAAMPMLLKIAPVETPTKPLDEKEKKYFRKKMVRNLILEIAAVLTLLSIGHYKLGFIISLGIAVSACLALWQKLLDERT